MGKRRREHKREKAERHARIKGRKSAAAVAKAEKIARHHPNSVRARQSARRADAAVAVAEAAAQKSHEVQYTTSIRDKRDMRIKQRHELKTLQKEVDNSRRRDKRKSALNSAVAVVVAPAKLVGNVAKTGMGVATDLGKGARSLGEGAGAGAKGAGTFLSSCVIL